MLLSTTVARLTLLSLALFVASNGLAQEANDSTADHSKFEILQQDFATGPEVTAACLSCHTEAAAQIHDTIHWTWEFEHPTTGQVLGKRHVINSFCGAVRSNEPRCTSCHAGYGWQDDSFDFTNETLVDCLVCHDQSGGYKKFPTGAGHPAYEDKPFMGRTFPAVDLGAAARSVGKPTRANCGSCHFTAGGGDGVKHGDIDSSLANPPLALDVHMSSEGANFDCRDCHQTAGHEITGSRYHTTARDTVGTGQPGERRGVTSCESCHGLSPHTDADVEFIEARLLDNHTSRIACQTCHIPAFARGGVPTKTYWDWSTAGELDDQGKPIVRKDENGVVIYDAKKGGFEWGENVEPSYAWFDGNMRYSLLGDSFGDTEVVQINTFGGGPDDPSSRIWPFKIMRGKQPYDAVNQSLVFTHLFGKDEAAYWKTFNWPDAITAGMQGTGVEYSGEYDFIETTMYWPTTHMVPPASEALECDSCHKPVGGRMAGLGGFYMPGRDRVGWLDHIGFTLVGITALGVMLHALLRVLTRRRRGGTDHG